MTVQRRGNDPHTWTIRYDERVGPGEPRRRVRKSFHGTQKEAVAEDLRLQGLAKRGVATANRGKTPFAAFCEEWIEHRRALVSTADDDDDEVAAATFDADRRRVKNHIIPVLGKYKIGDIGPRDIERAKAAWKLRPNVLKPEKTLGRKTIFHIYSLTRKILNDAVLWRFIESNPCAGVRVPKKGNAALSATPPADAMRLIEHDSLAPVHVAALVALLTGARRGELLALHRSDLDFEAGLIRYRRALTALDGRTFSKALKTGDKGHKDVPMFFLADLLAAYLSAHLEIADGPIFCRGGLPRNSGKYWMPAAFSKALKRHLEQLGISGQSAQRLRHAFNSLGALTGSDELTRSKLMGHTGVQMTRGRYTTIYSEAARKTIAMLEASLNIGTKLGPNEPERFVP